MHQLRAMGPGSLRPQIAIGANRANAPDESTVRIRMQDPLLLLKNSFTLSEHRIEAKLALFTLGALQPELRSALTVAGGVTLGALLGEPCRRMSDRKLG